MGTKLKQWPKWLCWVEYWFNTNYNSSTLTIPFKALYGRDPVTLLRGDMTPSHIEEVNQPVYERNLMLDELKWRLSKAQTRIKAQSNKRRREVEFEVGDMVYLKK